MTLSQSVFTVIEGANVRTTLNLVLNAKHNTKIISFLSITEYSAEITKDLNFG